MTEDEKIQRLLSEQRHNQIVELLQSIRDLLMMLVKNNIEEEKKEGE